MAPCVTAGQRTASVKVRRGIDTSAPRRLWYSARAVRDMTGDGRADTLTLEAIGERPENLQMIFRIRGSGRELFREEWTSHDRYGDFLADDGKPLISRDSLIRLVHIEMDDFFAPRNFGTTASLTFARSWHYVFDGDDPRDHVAWAVAEANVIAARKRRGQLTNPENITDARTYYDEIAKAPFDTARVRAIGAEMQRRRLPTFAFAYGYESNETITWSPMAGRFFQVWYSD